MIKNFIIKLIKFLLYFNIIYFIVIFLIGYFFNSSDFFKNINNKTLILGDSHTETSINDSIFNNSINMSQSAETYLYSYIKLNKVLKHNDKLKKVILSFSKHNISKGIEKWYTENENISFKLPNYYYLMSLEEIKDLFISNPTEFVKSYFKILYKKGKDVPKLKRKTMTLPNFEIGYFRELKGNNILIDSINNTKIINNEIFKPSTIQVKYLKKIIKKCKESNIELILINTPVYKPFAHKNSVFINDFIKTELQNVRYLNYYELYGDKGLYFYDKDHLNLKGATLFSQKIDSIFK
jgi:hypothetical protein